MSWFGCKACVAQEKHIRALLDEILSLKSQLAHSREREEKAVDTLLRHKGDDSIRPAGKMSQVDSEKAMESLFKIFKDEDDTGDGAIQEADRLNAADERR